MWIQSVVVLVLASTSTQFESKEIQLNISAIYCVIKGAIQYMIENDFLSLFMECRIRKSIKEKNYKIMISFKDFRKLQRNYRYNHLVSKKNVLSIYGIVVNVITLDKQTRVENHSSDVCNGNSKYCTQEWEVKSKMTQLVLWIIQDANIKIEIYFKIILKHSYKDARLQNFASCGSLKQTTLISAEVIKQKVSSFVESLWSKAWGRWKRWK